MQAFRLGRYPIHFHMMGQVRYLIAQHCATLVVVRARSPEQHVFGTSTWSIFELLVLTVGSCLTRAVQSGAWKLHQGCSCARDVQPCRNSSWGALPNDPRRCSAQQHGSHVLHRGCHRVAEQVRLLPVNCLVSEHPQVRCTYYKAADPHLLLTFTEKNAIATIARNPLDRPWAP